MGLKVRSSLSADKLLLLTKMASLVLSFIVCACVAPFVVAARGIGLTRKLVHTVTVEIKCLWEDFIDGVKWGFKQLSFSWMIVFLVVEVLSALIVGPGPTATLSAITFLCVGAKFGGRVPRYVRVHVDRIRDAWEQGVADDDCSEAVAVTSMTRVKKGLRPALACKIAVRAVAKVGLLKRSEANSMVYQRVCLDVMEGMKMRWHDRLVILPQAVLACLERPQEVEEVMKAIEASCKGRFDVY